MYHKTMVRATYGAFPLQHVARFKRAVPNPARFFFFPLGVVPAQGYFFTFFLALQNRGSYRANNQAEYAKLVT